MKSHLLATLSTLLLFIVSSSALVAQNKNPPKNDKPGENSAAEQQEDSRQCFEPTSFSTYRGTVVSVKFSDFLKSDDQRAIYWPGFTILANEGPITLRFDVNAPTTTSFMFEARARGPGLTFSLEAWNPSEFRFDVIGSASQSVNQDEVVEFAIDPEQHIGADGDVRAQLAWRQTGFIVAFPWQVEVDQFAFCAGD